MTFQQKNFAVTLVNFCLILSFYLFRLYQLAQNGNFNETTLFRLWGIIILCAIVVTILATILTHIVSAVIEAIQTQEVPVVQDMADERDQLIDLKGTRTTYSVASLGTFFAMLYFVFWQDPLVMFALLIFFGVVAQIVGDATRLYLYQKGV